MQKFSAAKLQKIFARCGALFLCVWMSGAFCALSCAAMEMRAATPTAEKTFSCPMHEPRTTDSENADLSDSASPHESPLANRTPLNCCSFFNLTANKTEQTHQFSAPVATAKFSFNFGVSQTQRRIAFAKTYQTILLNCGEIYLRNCVFRI